MKFINVHPRLWIKTLASSSLTFAILPCMMVLLVIGTLAQRELGLYGALDRFFYSWIAFLGPVPLPGGLTVMGLFFVNLLARFIGYSIWTREKAGIHLAHFGVILLLVGGIVSGVSRVDTVIPLDEGETVVMSQSYDESALFIYKNNRVIDSVPLQGLKDSQTVPLPDTGFEISVISHCYNCEIKLRDDVDNEWQGPAQKMRLEGTAPEIDPEQNLPGLEFRLTFTDERPPEKHAAFLYFPKPPTVQIGDDTYLFTVERQRFPLPFEITLNDFSMEVWPGTLQAKGYQSSITIHDGGNEIPALISMNEPVSYKGYKLYQSAFQMRADGSQSSIIAVVYNKGRIFPYIAGLIMALGLLLHLVLRFRTKAALALLVFLVFPATAQAQTIDTGKDLATLPVLHDGRIKPLDSFARIHLKLFSGRETPLKTPAVQTLADLVFKPYTAVHYKIFAVKDQPLQLRLGLTPGRKLYSYIELAPGLDKTRDDFISALQKQRARQTLTEQEKQLTALHSKSLYFLQLVRSFSFAMPLDGETPRTYQDLQRQTAQLQDELQRIRSKKGTDLDTYSKDDLNTAYKGYQLNLLTRTGENNLLFRVIPSADTDEVMTAPWQVLTGGRGTPETQAYMEHWTKLMLAWQTDDAALWDTSLQALHALYDDRLDTRSLRLEYQYNRLHPVLLTTVLSFLAMLCFIIAAIHKTKGFERAGLAAGIASVAVLGGTLLFRVALLDRPPVGTLYESLLFVGLILGLAPAACRRAENRNGLFALVFGAVGLLLMLAASLDREGDTLQLLEAVLNTNFWLTTHVLVITAGYGWCLLTSALAHVQLFNAARAKPVVLAPLHTHALISLFLISTGTVLGGIWADMSWGRFWGWDPKENGALLIALWLIWALHGRASRHLGDVGYAVCLAALASVVMVSWFGVNLLNVGLHSYGFVSGIAEALFGFILVQVITLALLVRKTRA